MSFRMNDYDPVDQSGWTTPPMKGGGHSNYTPGESPNDDHITQHSGGTYTAAPEVGGRSGGSFIKSIVYGGLDGILTTLAIVAGATGGGLSTLIILIVGFSNKIADGLSMGLGDTLSSMAENEHIMQEREKERLEMQYYPEGEIEEMMRIYEDRGMTSEDAERIVNEMAQHIDFFVDIMMVEELGMQVPDADNSPIKDGCVTFTSFLCFGLMPLITYCIFPFIMPQLSQHQLFGCSSVITACVLFVLGAVKSRFSDKTALRSGTEMLVFGAVVAGASYFMGLGTSMYVVPDLHYAPTTGVS